MHCVTLTQIAIAQAAVWKGLKQNRYSQAGSTVGMGGVAAAMGMDDVGPFTESERGIQHVLVVVDYFSRFVWFLPCKSTGAGPLKS